MGETRRNLYPRLEGTGFVRVQNWLPGPVPRRTLPVTPTGFGTRGIPYLRPSSLVLVLVFDASEGGLAVGGKLEGGK